MANGVHMYRSSRSQPIFERGSDDMSFEDTPREDNDPLARTDELVSQEVPSGIDRRTFLMRSAVVGATTVITGRTISAQERADRSTAPAPQAPPLSPELEVVKQEKGPV